MASRALPQPAVPRSLLACLPVLWRSVLFPGDTAPPDRWRWAPFLVLLVLPALLLYPCLSFYLFEPDEGRYAQIPREMCARGEWIVPQLQGEPYLDKPPLFYWLVMLSYSVLGVHDWSARLVPAMAVHATILITYLFGRRALGQRAGFWGALALMLAPAFLSMGRLLILDGVLAFFVALSLFAAWEATRGPTLQRGWWLLAAGACGLGVLTKGPVAVLLLAPPLWLNRRLAGEGARIGWRAVAAFAAVVALVAAPWYVAVCLRLSEFAGYFLWEHNVVRFVMPFAHKQPVWFYGPVLLAGFLPATLLLVPWLRFLFSGAEAARSRRSPQMGFVLLAGIWCVGFFSLSDCKLATYLLPAYPFLALAFGCFVAHTRWHFSRWTAAATVTTLALMLSAHYAVIPWIAHTRSPMRHAREVWAYCRDRDVAVACYPRPIDSVAFYTGRSDFKSYRSKETAILLQHLQQRPRTVVLFSHRHSLKQLRDVLPPHLRMTVERKLGLCDMAVVERADERARR